MQSFFKEFFTYNHHCNQKLAEIILKNQVKTTEKSLQWFNHILNAHQIWNSRIEGRKDVFGVWDMHPRQELKPIDQANFETSLRLLDVRNLDAIIEYSNSKGKTFQNSIRDILLHIVNHSTYHRGQIASNWRAHGMTPLVTDYIFYKRE